MVSKGKSYYDSLLDVKSIWTVAEAARLLSDYWKREISEADIYMSALEGKLKLSVKILKEMSAKPYKFTDENGGGHTEEVEIKLGRHTVKSDFPDYAREIKGLYDLCMNGGGGLYVKYKWQKSMRVPARKDRSLWGIFVENDGQVFQLQERTGEVSSSNIWRPLQCFSDDIPLIIRSSVLRDLIEKKKRPSKANNGGNSAKLEEQYGPEQSKNKKVKSVTHSIGWPVDSPMSKDDSELVASSLPNLIEVAKVEKQCPSPSEIVNGSNLLAHQAEKINGANQPNKNTKKSKIRLIDEGVEPPSPSKGDEIAPPQQLLSDSGYLRLDQIIGNPKKGIPAIIPVSKSTWWAGVKSGRYPQPIKLSDRCVAWKTSDIMALLEDMGKKLK